MGSYGLQLYTAPTWEPLSVSEAKKQVEVSSSDSAHDEHLGRLITAARQYIEERTGRALCTQTWELYLDELPTGNELLLPRAPLASVTSLKYYDADGVQQTWSSANYIVSTSREPGRIRLAYGISWPTIQYRADAVVVRYVAGYSTQTAIPMRIKQAVLLLVGHWFENRSAAVPVELKEIPLAVESLIQQATVGDEFHDYAGLYA